MAQKQKQNAPEEPLDINICLDDNDLGHFISMFLIDIIHDHKKLINTLSNDGNSSGCGLTVIASMITHGILTTNLIKTNITWNRYQIIAMWLFRYVYSQINYNLRQWDLIGSAIPQQNPNKSQYGVPIIPDNTITLLPSNILATKSRCTGPVAFAENKSIILTNAKQEPPVCKSKSLSTTQVKPRIKGTISQAPWFIKYVNTTMDTTEHLVREVMRGGGIPADRA